MSAIEYRMKLLLACLFAAILALSVATPANGQVVVAIGNGHHHHHRHHHHHHRHYRR